MYIYIRKVKFMDTFIQILKAIVFGIVEGITEWLPVSSTGHMLILQEFLPLPNSTPDEQAFFTFFLCKKIKW